MDDSDWQLLDKQMSNQLPPSRSGGPIILILVGGFLAGLAASSLLFEIRPSTQHAATSGKTALAFFLDGGRNPTR
jgi:hypothetical protein